ncbi:MAG: ATP-binding cassette domain-containing protein [Bacteroidota bacterium]
MIEVRDLTYRYAPDAPDVLNGITLLIPEGSFTAIMGSNGSGKSTLARCLNGLCKPTGGSVLVDGFRTDDDARSREIRRKVGLVFQDPNLQITSVTVERELAFGLENIGTGPEEMRERVEKYLGLFGFNGKNDVSPSSLSAGERQRLAVASVMILEPSYLVLDEATSLLSVRSRNAMLDLVRDIRMQASVGIILITQFPREAMLGERLLVMHEGRLVFDGSPGEVFKNVESLLQMGVPVPTSERLRVAV